ncbi:MAG: biotin/lipoyl-containing protein [Myxococcota bacterium]
MKWHVDGRMFAESLVATATVTDAGIVLRSPTVGMWRDRPAPGSLVRPGDSIGALEVLGVVHRLVAPPDAAGIVVDDASGERLARVPVDASTPLVTLDPKGSVATAGLAVGAQASADDGSGLVFRSPLAGRYYARPAPDEDPFVSVGDVVTQGQTVALLEVMKTFNRITYGGDGLPARAKVVAIVPKDEADIDEDDVVLKLEAE